MSIGRLGASGIVVAVDWTMRLRLSLWLGSRDERVADRCFLVSTLQLR
jgi:hypothetical protein